MLNYLDSRLFLDGLLKRLYLGWENCSPYTTTNEHLLALDFVLRTAMLTHMKVSSTPTPELLRRVRKQRKQLRIHIPGTHPDTTYWSNSYISVRGNYYSCHNQKVWGSNPEEAGAFHLSLKLICNCVWSNFIWFDSKHIYSRYRYMMTKSYIAWHQNRCLPTMWKNNMLRWES